MTKQELDKFKKLLLEKRKELLNKSSTYKADDVLTIREEESVDETDVASQATMRDLSCSLINRDFEILKKITDALARIEAGTFGICEDCGLEIANKRLMVQPWAELCIIHAEEHEHKLRTKNIS